MATMGVVIISKAFSKSFYSSAAWQDCRNEYMKRAHHLCEDCLDKGIIKPAEIVHHVIELTPMNINQAEITLNPDNLRAVCRECHNEHHDAHGRWNKINSEKIKKRDEKNRYKVDSYGRVTENNPPTCGFVK